MEEAERITEETEIRQMSPPALIIRGAAPLSGLDLYGRLCAALRPPHELARIHFRRSTSLERRDFLSFFPPSRLALSVGSCRHSILIALLASIWTSCSFLHLTLQTSTSSRFEEISSLRSARATLCAFQRR